MYFQNTLVAQNMIKDQKKVFENHILKFSL